MSESTDRKDLEDVRLGSHLGKYRLIRRIGRGGMGVVYEAEDTVLRRCVAIKLLAEQTGAEPDSVRRLLHEAQAAARLNHPNVVTIHEVNNRDGANFIAMELVDGGSAQDFLETMGPFNWLEATRVIADACRGLAAAHAAGLIHRDIKPANIMRSGDGVVKLADFGLAKITDRPGVSISGPGTLVGTPHYMSPEQCRFDPIDDLSDIYSLGATYFALLTGKPPYPGDLPMQVMYAHCSSPVPDPRELDPRVPEKVVAIVRKAMAKLPDERFRNAADMLAALDAVLASVATGRRTKPSQWSLAIKAHRDHSKGRANATHGPRRRRGKDFVAMAAVLLIAFAASLVGFIMHRSKPHDTVESYEAKGRNEAQDGLKHPAASKVPPAPPATSAGDVIKLPGAATALALSTKDARVAVGCQPSSGHDIVCLGEPQAGKLQEIALHNIPIQHAARNGVRPWRVRAIAFHFRTGRLVVAVHDGEVAGVAVLSPGSAPRWESWFELPIPQATSLTLSRDGVRVAAAFKKAGTQTESVKVWNWQEQKAIDTIDGLGGVTALAFSPSASGTLAIGHSTGSVRVVDQTAKATRSFETGASVRSLSFASGGNFLGVAGGRKLVIYSLVRNQAMSFPTQGEAQSLAFFPGGSHLIAGIESGGRGTIEVFRMPNSTSTERLEAHDGPVSLASFTPDGVLFTAGRDRTLRKWRLHSTNNADPVAEQANRGQP